MKLSVVIRINLTISGGPSGLQSVRCPLTPISRHAISPYSVEAFNKKDDTLIYHVG